MSYERRCRDRRNAMDELIAPPLLEHVEMEYGLHCAGRVVGAPMDVNAWFVAKSANDLDPIGVVVVRQHTRLLVAQEIPASIVLEAHVAMVHTGMPHAWAAVLLSGEDLIVEELERDPDLICALGELSARGLGAMLHVTGAM